MKHQLQYFPITMFAIVMGLTGLTIVFHRFSEIGAMPIFFFQANLAIVTLLFLFFLVTYLRKAIKYPNEVKSDFNHRIRVNFFSAFSISFMLLSIAYFPLFPDVSKVLWWIGVSVHTFLMLHTISFWIQHNFEIQTMNPAWFIPVVGNIIVPVAGVEFMPASFNFFYFSVGFFFWLVLFTIFLNRAIFHHQMPQKFMPTLFILIAPPAVGFIAWFKITQSFDMFAQFLLMMTYFFLALLLFLRKNFYKLTFYLSWWAFTFPLTAATLASVMAFHLTHQLFYKVMAFILMIISIMVIALVTWKTIQKIREGQICINEDK
jgi:tellurite resistance protein